MNESPNQTQNQTKKDNMQNENTPIENVEPIPSRRISRKARLGILGGTLLVAGALGAWALNNLMPKLPNRAQGVTDRLAWYVQHGQLKADWHTFASAVAYIVASDAEYPGATVPENPPVAGSVAPTPPKS
jgi:hypothetical protein